MKFAFWQRKHRSSGEITPEEIFMDSHNLPSFDTHQFEGRLTKPISPLSITMLLIVFTFGALVFSMRIGTLQIAKGEYFADLSENNRLRHTPVFASRGVIYDRNEIALAWNEPRAEESDFALRKYRDEKGLAHVLGYLNYPKKDSSGVYYQREFKGQDGIEKQFNDTLKGEDGLKIVETDALGKLASESVIDLPQNGEDLVLSIDSRVQEKMYDLMHGLATQVGFSGGAGVIMDIHTGEVVTLVSYPEYDPNILTDGSDVDTIGRYNSDTRTPFLNRAVSGVYTPGSIVKPIMAIAGLAEGVITATTKILSTGSITLPNPYYPELKSVFTDWKEHGYVDVRKALAVSSNVFFYEIGGGFQNQKGIGIENIDRYSRLFGLGAPTQLNLSGEASGVIPNPAWKEENFDGDPWRVGDTYFTSIGQYGFQVTPIQMARMSSVIGNGGTVLKPTLLKQSKENTELGTQILSKVEIPQEYFSVVQEGMREAVLSGTAAGLNTSAVKIAGKTGTAELGVSKSLVNSWVTGYFPYDNPKYSFAIVMERGPRKNLLGGTYVMRGLVDWMAVHTPEYFE